MSVRHTLTLAALVCLLTPPVEAVEATSATRGKKYALLIGINDYDSAGFSDLAYAENDAEELAAVLKGKGAGFDSVVVMTARRGKTSAALKPNTKNINAALKTLMANKTKHDTLIVGFAGHGVQLKLKGTTKDESFFCPANAQLNDQTTLISLTKVFKDLDNCGAGTKLLLVDACRNTPKATRSVDLDLLPRPGRGIAALFSCKSGECANESGALGKGHGVFFYFVIEGLKGKARNKKNVVTWNGLVDYVTDQVTDEASKLVGSKIKQTPQELRNFQGKSPLLVEGGQSTVDAEADKLFKQGWDFHMKGTHDWVKAKDSLERSTRKGHALASVCLAIWHTTDKEEKARLVKKALPELKKKAEGGDAVAQVLLGFCCSNGIGIDRDADAASKWYTSSAAQKNALAEYYLGVWYEVGRNVTMDWATAVSWYRKAASRDYPFAQCSLGRMYNYGRGVEKDNKEAAKWYAKAVANGHLEAHVRLAVLYRNGDGVTKDAVEAVKLLRKAADRNWTDAQRILGIHYAEGTGVGKDEKEAVALFKKAAEKNDEYAQWCLGRMYEQGRGVSKDTEAALLWYRKAAETAKKKGLTPMSSITDAIKRLEAAKKPAALLKPDKKPLGNSAPNMLGD